MMKKMNIRIVFLGLALATVGSLMTACGSSGTSTVRLNIFNGAQPQTSEKNLMTALTTLSLPQYDAKVGSLTCIQRNLYAGMSPTGAQKFVTFPTNMVTPYAFSGNDIASFLDKYSVGASVDIPVVNGSTVDFGIVGNLSFSATAPTGDDCELNSAGGGTPNPSYSVIGHQDKVTISGSTQITLPVWVLNSGVSPTVGSGCAATSDSLANANSGLNQQCAPRDFYKITCSNCSGLIAAQFIFEYFQGENRSDHPTQLIASSAFNSAGFISLPSLDLITVTILSSDSHVMGSTKIDNRSWSGQSSGTFPITLSTGETINLIFANYPSQT